MYFNEGMIIKHKAWLDVAFRVDYAIVEFGRYEVHGSWINLGQHKSWVIDRDILKIQGQEIDDKKWFACVEPEAKCYRHEEWIQIF